jgi:hypothetical protein
MKKFLLLSLLVASAVVRVEAAKPKYYSCLIDRGFIAKQTQASEKTAGPRYFKYFNQNKAERDELYKRVPATTGDWNGGVTVMARKLGDVTAQKPSEVFAQQCLEKINSDELFYQDVKNKIPDTPLGVWMIIVRHKYDTKEEMATTFDKLSHAQKVRFNNDQQKVVKVGSAWYAS